jgi:hypothetical protein
MNGRKYCTRRPGHIWETICLCYSQSLVRKKIIPWTRADCNIYTRSLTEIPRTYPSVKYFFDCNDQILPSFIPSHLTVTSQGWIHDFWNGSGQPLKKGAHGGGAAPESEHRSAKLYYISAFIARRNKSGDKMYTLLDPPEIHFSRLIQENTR